jgi:hypothetical protein
MRADLHVGSVEGGLVLVTLSRRNLLALLAKLDEQVSGRKITGGYVFCDDDLLDGVTLAVRSEPDEEHYADREPPGPMSPTTEAGIEMLTQSQLTPWSDPVHS